MIRVHIEFEDDGRPAATPADAKRDFDAAARVLAGTLADLGGWPSMDGLTGIDAAIVADRFACAAAFVRWASAELEVAEVSLGFAARVEGGGR